VFDCGARGLRARRIERRLASTVLVAALLSVAAVGTAVADTTPVTTIDAPTTTTDPAATTVPPPTTVPTVATTSTSTTTASTSSTSGTTTIATTATSPGTTTAATTTATQPATTAPVKPPTASACAGAGMLVLLVPHEAPRIVGPAVSARTPAGSGATTFQYPTNGSVLRSVRPRADVSGCAGSSGPRTATSAVQSLSLFGGAVRAARVTAALVRRRPAAHWRLQVNVRGLRIEGHRVTPRPEAQLAVGRWGRLLLDGAHVSPSGSPGLGWWRAGLELRFLRAHAGLPKGTELLVAYVAANKPFAAVEHLGLKRVHTRKAKVGAPLTVTPPLRGGPYVFPVAADIGVADTYAASRSDVPGGWHHGDDLFSGLGSPVVAVADGTVFSVGWNRLGGWRLWLRDRRGNEFYYAHLSGYTRLARDGDRVTAGQPLAFVGHTGDAITTPHHLHFEIHPVGLLRLGYDGAVDPTGYLRSWRHVTRVAPLEPVRLPAGAALNGEGALSDYRQLLAVKGLLPHARVKHIAVPSLLSRPVLPALDVTPAALASAHAWASPTALAAALAALLSVAALLLRARIGVVARRVRARVRA
jgi:hypothetical protein